MKYSLIFAATAAAYDAYGKDSYGDKPAAKPSCLATITPGYGKEPVTITKQHQPYPTCVQKGYGDKSCDKWGEDTYVHTTIKDYNGKDYVVTKTNDKVTVYYEKKTITHTETGKYGAKPTPADNKYPAPTGYADKEHTDDKGCWYELYEKVETAEYGKLGPHALKGYPGSGLCKDSDKEQEVYVKEYKDGKWGNEYQTKHYYGKPEAEVTSYEKPGVYTIPGKDKTVDSTLYYGAEATKTAKAGETCTYGGQYTDAKETGYITAGYADYETKVYGDKTSTSTVLKYTTIYVTSTGKVEVCKPTTTVYDHDTTFAYPTASYYKPGVYHQEPKTVTVTKGGESYTCEYKPTPIKGNKWGYDSYPTATPKKDEGYKAQPTPYKPTEGDKDYPSYPVPANGTNYYTKPSGEYPAATPVYGDKPYDGKTNKDGKDYPAPPASTPCDDDKSYPTGKPTKPYGDKPTHDSDKPTYGDKPSHPEGDKPVYGDKPNHPEGDKPVYGDKPSHPENSYPTPTPVYGSSYDGKTGKDGKDYPAPPASTPCDEDDKKKGYPTPTPVKGAGYAKRGSMMARRRAL